MSNSQPVDVASVVASRDRLHAALGALATAIEEHADVEVIGPKTAHTRAIASLRQDVVRLGTKFAEDRLLRLGVVGQVKAGKSSLLNLLLFGGKEVLPKAATPMTASLTHISKSDRDEIEVEYYTKKDWAKIEEHAKEHKRMKAGEDRTAQVPAFQACHELVEMAAKRGLQVDQHLGTTAAETVPVSDMNDKLTGLVGADGKLTPLVKSVAIRCAYGIPDLDIVDTPGINDPISSRSRRTERMLVDCDAVLLLSYASQFMEDVDIKFFERKLPQEGISNRLIICSKFDSALIDEAPKFQNNLQRAQDDIKQSLERHAREAIQRLTEDAPESAADAQIVFISVMCSKLAVTPYEQWNQEEESIFDRLRSAYPDWLDAADESTGAITKTTKETLEMLGNQRQVDDHLEELRRDKEQHIFASNQQTVEAKRVAAEKEVDELLEHLRIYREKINSVKSEQVDKQMKKLVELEHKLKDMIGNEWRSRVSQEETKWLMTFQNELYDVAKLAREAIGKASGPQTGNREKKKRGFWNAVGRGLGLNRWDIVEEEYQVLHLGEVDGAVDDVSAFINHKLVNLRLKMFTDDDFVRKSHEALGSIVDNKLGNSTAEDYDVEMIRASLRDTIATAAANMRDELERGGHFQPRELALSPKKADEGRRQATDVVKFLEEQVNIWVMQVHKEWSQITKQAESELVPLVVAELRKSQEQLKRDIEDRTRKTVRIGKALQSIEQCQVALSGRT